jgi:predicted helicase
MAKIFHASLHGLSKAKDLALLTSDIDKTEWSDVDLEVSSSYLLIPQSSYLKKEYDQGWKIDDFMIEKSLGILSKRDSLVIGFREDEVSKKIEAFINSEISDIECAHLFDLPLQDNDKWDITKARVNARRYFDCKSIQPISYRPFDSRCIYYSDDLIARPNTRVMQHMNHDINQSLIIGRQGQAVDSHNWNVIFASSGMADQNIFRRGGGTVFPLYLYPKTDAERMMGISIHPNLSQEFLRDITTRLGYSPTPENIFNYIYAIFHCPEYRSRYAEFLKGDFPRVPLTRNVDRFQQLSELGEQLVNLHLMKSPILNETSSPFIDNGGGCIVDAGHPKYENGKVVINKQKDGFMDVPEAVWNFHIGGYQVCHKWLKDRKGRTLSQDDIEHYQKIVIALGQSIELMKQIDEAIPSWPMDAEYN